MMLWKKYVYITIAVILVIIVCYYLFFWGSYVNELEKQKAQWEEKEFKPKELKGIIMDIERDKSSSFFINLIILTNTKERIAYGLCIDKNKEFINFIEVGDSVVKKQNELFMTFLKKNKQRKDFYLPFCN